MLFVLSVVYSVYAQAGREPAMFLPFYNDLCPSGVVEGTAGALVTLSNQRVTCGSERGAKFRPGFVKDISNIQFGGDGWSFSMWVYIESFVDNMVLFQTYVRRGQQDFKIAFYGSTQTIAVSYYQDATHHWEVRSIMPAWLGAQGWINIAVAGGSGMVRVYQNGGWMPTETLSQSNLVLGHVDQISRQFSRIGNSPAGSLVFDGWFWDFYYFPFEAEHTIFERFARVVRQREAKSLGDPHITRLDGTTFDIDAPGTYTMLKIPAETGAEMQVTSKVGKRNEGMYNEEVSVSGSWLDDLTLKITAYPFTLDVGGKTYELSHISDNTLTELVSLLDSSVGVVKCDYTPETQRDWSEACKKSFRKSLMGMSRRFMQIKTPGGLLKIGSNGPTVDIEFAEAGGAVSVGGILGSTVTVSKPVIA